MAIRKNRAFAKLATNVDADGDVTTTGLASDITADIAAAGTAVYDSAALLPIAGNTAGDTAFVKSTSRLYIHSGLGWYNVAVINNTPTVQSILDSDGGTTPFVLATDGTPTTITITAQDSDGDPLTYNYSADSDFSGLATLSQDANVFTITPFSSDSATTTSGTITFSVTDGINTATPSAQTFTLSFLSALWDETVLSIGTSSTNGLNNSTFIDRSTNAWGSTVNTWGTSFAQTAFHPYLDKWSVFLDGANDTTTSLSHTLPSSLNMGTGDFTIELWCKSYVNADRDGLFTFTNSSAAYKFMLRNATSAEVWELYHTVGVAVTVTYADSANPLNEWVHHALVRSSGTLVWYINGVAKQTIAHTYDFSDADLVEVGRYGGAPWPGWISNFRVIKGDAIYTSNFTVPTEPLSVTANTVLLLNAGNSFKNRGSLTTTIETTSAPQVSAYNPFGQGSEYAVGENKGSVSFTTTDGIDLKVRSSGTASTWTIEFWYKFDPTSTINANHYLLDARGTAGSQTAGSLYLYRVNSSTYEDGGSYGVTDANFNDGAWHWFTMVSDGTNRAVWIDGIRIAELGGTRTVGTHLWINSRNSDQYHNDCDISDFRFSSTARYATSSTTISVPTSPVGTDGNTTAYYPFDNAGIFDKTGNHTLELSGDTSTSTTYTKYSNTSAFTDTGGILIKQVPSFGSSDFTIEGWFYPTEVPGTGNAFIGHAWGGYGSFLFYSSNTQYSLYMSGSGSGWDIVGGENVNVTPWTGSWKHFAFTRSGNVVRVFLDGTQTYTKTISGSLMAVTGGTNDILSIGSAIDGTSGVHGAMYVENFQVLKGVAKYTTNFTPPTEEQGRGYQAED